mmetsp:Transcript_53480/g.141837  ORF Transcript_53480/g.141837 Transcript_53480/m.141837 type:complete len:146 (-) Transcript_53480:20059-20496(-)
MNIIIKYLQKRKERLLYLNQRHNIFFKNIINMHYKNTIRVRAKIIFGFLYFMKNKSVNCQPRKQIKYKERQRPIGCFYKKFFLKEQMRTVFFFSFSFKLFIFKLTLCFFELFSNIYRILYSIKYIKYFFFRYKTNCISLFPIKLL